MTTAATIPTDAPKVVSEIFEILAALIDPDPEQPRIDVDDEIAASMKEHGFWKEKPMELRVHPALEGRYMIVDGERRWRGAVKAGLKTVYATIAADPDLEISLADRLVKQIVHNQGKPLSPVEEALAFKRIVDDRRAAGEKSYGPVQLAREVQMAKSTVSDRLALATLPKFWLDHVKKGRIQPSAAPILARWRAVPEEYQRRAIRSIEQEWQWQKAGRNHEPIENDELERLLWTHLKKYIRPLSEVGSEYSGAVVEMKGHGYGESRKKYAMDPSQWQPIVNKAKREKAKRAKAKAEKSGAAPTKSGAPKGIVIPRWVQALIERGAKRTSYKPYSYRQGGDDILRVEGGRHQWVFSQDENLFDPTTLMEKLSPAKVAVWVPERASSYSSSNTIYIETSDSSALSAARSVVRKAAAEAFERIQVAIAAKLQKNTATVRGAGAKYLLVLLLDQDDSYNPQMAMLLHDVGAALQLKGFDTLQRKSVAKHVANMPAADAEQLATAIAGVASLDIALPQKQLDAWYKKERERLAKVHPKDWPALGKAVAAAGDEEVEVEADDAGEAEPDGDEVEDDDKQEG